MCARPHDEPVSFNREVKLISRRKASFLCQGVITSFTLERRGDSASYRRPGLVSAAMIIDKTFTMFRALSSVTLAVCGVVTLALIGFPAQHLLTEDITNLGGDLSSDLPDRHSIQVPAPNVTNPERINQQVAGFPVFHRITTKADGLGPRYINNSCGGCHVNNGRGPAVLNPKAKNGSTMVVKLQRRRLRKDGSPIAVRGFGSQLRDHSVRSKDKPDTMRLSWRGVRGQYADGSVYRLRKPKLTVTSRTPLPRGSVASLRMSPALIGQGLLEAVPDATITGLSDPNDVNGDGISGRVNMVPDVSTNQSAVGRFGFKATQPTVFQQSGAALFQDMQITNPLFYSKPSRFEVSLEQLHSMAVYLRLAGVPKARNQGEPSVMAGKGLFVQLGCNACHVMTLTTGSHTDPELSNQTIHPFTDLLLHDMGPGLADGWSEYSAQGREWRTAPLWGLGFASQLTKAGEKPLYLHDGRARTIEEAILWHGGEAQASKERFLALPAGERKNLLDFLDSL